MNGLVRCELTEKAPQSLWVGEQMTVMSEQTYKSEQRLDLWLLWPWLTFALAAVWFGQFIHANEGAANLFRYSANLAETGVISYNPGGQPVEGATDFLYMVAIAGLAFFGADTHAAAILINILAFGAILVLLRRNGALDMHTGLGISAAFFVMAPFAAALAGFNVFAFCAAILACIVFVIERRVLAFSISALLCCLIRPDGFVFAAPLALLLMYQIRDTPRQYITIGLALVLPGIAYFLWRWWYFGELMPLPFYVKAEVDRDVLGVFYSGSLKELAPMGDALIIGILALGVSFWRGVLSARQLGPVLAAAFLPALTFYLSMNLIQNLGLRFFAFVPLLAVVAICNIADRHARIVFLAALILTLAPKGSPHFRYLAFDSNDRYIAHAISQLPGNFSMAVTEAGHLAYESGAEVVDLWGLNTPQFARVPASGADIAARQFDMIVLHDASSYTCQAMVAQHKAQRLGPVQGPVEDAPRSWPDMVESVLSGVDPETYRLYRVPAFRPQNHWHYMFFVNNSGPHSEALTEILLANNGEACAN